METRKGQLTGTYYCLPGSSEEEYKIALFISKRVADTYVRLTRKSDLVVRGVNQAQLKGLIELSKNHKLTFHLAMFEPLNCKEWTFMELSTEIVNQDYCLS
jgi:predicted transcriptional regulator